METVLVAGALANKPGNGGEAWVRLSWLLGLRRLGVDVWLVEQIDPASCRNERGEPVAVEASQNLSWFQRVVERFGFTQRAALVDCDGRSLAGVSSDQLADVAAGAALLINISGNLTATRLFDAVANRAYLDLDPGYTQFWHRAGALGSLLERHRHLLTVALAIGRSSCTLPTDGLRWRAVAPPVVLEEWPLASSAGAALTTVASWRGGYGRLEVDGRRYGQKAHEFRRFSAVPANSGARCEAALEIHDGDAADAGRLRAGGWSLVDPRTVAGDPDAFRDYVRGSAAELSPAQGVYVETRSGWFSDRTTRYLAGGRPALIQDTGVPETVPRGEGLLTFADAAEAVTGVQRILADYDRHARGARRLAEELFDSDVVLAPVLEDLLA